MNGRFGPPPHSLPGSRRPPETSASAPAINHNGYRVPGSSAASPGLHPQPVYGVYQLGPSEHLQQQYPQETLDPVDRARFGQQTMRGPIPGWPGQAPENWFAYGGPPPQGTPAAMAPLPQYTPGTSLSQVVHGHTPSQTTAVDAQNSWKTKQEGRHSKRKQVKRACIPCSNAKRKCDHERPCRQ